MARTCTICSKPQRPAIDKAIVAGTPLATIATEYHVIDESLRRHRDAHLPARLVKAAEAEEVAQADDLLAQVRSLQTRALSILDQAEQAGDLKVALSAIREARGNLELLAKLLGELDERPVINLTVSAEWLTLRSAILAALAPFAEARAAVASRLLEVESNGPGH